MQVVVRSYGASVPGGRAFFGRSEHQCDHGITGYISCSPEHIKNPLDAENQREPGARNADGFEDDYARDETGAPRRCSRDRGQQCRQKNSELRGEIQIDAKPPFLCRE